MAYLYRLNEQAREEYIEAYEWYEQKQNGLGDKFAKKIEKRLQQISEHPDYYGKRQSSHFREAKVENFPYMIVYEFFKKQQTIHIAAIYHSKRNPKLKYRKLT